MTENIYSESHRRTVLKSLVWRFIGIFWTWGGAYIIIILLPSKKQTALTIATLVTIWHHSTRMVMYYFYERIWAGLPWGKHTAHAEKPVLTSVQKIRWIIGVIIALLIIFFLLLYVTPGIKKNQKKAIEKEAVSAPSSP